MEPLSGGDPRAIGEFTLRARLGSGGMGRVYLGFSPGGRAVAIKVIHPELVGDPEFLHRFSREVASARAVSGMYTAPVVASGLGDNPPWMATAYVPGPPLADVVTRHGPLPVDAVWRLAAGLAEALRAVHACNLVHRDLKPSNVLMAPDGPHVIDFGISRAFEGTAVTSAGMVVGTPGYMSPEQAEGQQAGPPSDVFSLGCVLAFAATGTAPFGTGSAASVLYRVVTAEPDLRLMPDLLRQVIRACVNKRPSDRPGLSQLTAMISAHGPAIPLALGSFWPEPVASFVAGDQAYAAPTQVSPAAAGPLLAAPMAAAPPVAAPPVAAPPAAAPGAQPGSWAGPWAAGQPAPTVTSLGGGASGMGQPGPIQQGPIQQGPIQPDFAPPAPGPAPVPGPGQAPAPAPGGTGHAPMVADGYWPGPGGAGPQAGGTWYGAAAPQSATPWPQPAQSASWPQQQGPMTPWSSGGGPGTPGPLAQYTPGRRRPTRAELPGAVRTATRLMYVGAAATVLYVLFGAAAVHSYNLVLAHKMANDVGLTAVWGGAIGVVCWIAVATSCRRGHGWTRIAATILLAVHTVGMMTDMLVLKGEVQVKTTSAIIWGIGLAAVILLWSQESHAFFQAWRKR